MQWLVNQCCGTIQPLHLAERSIPHIEASIRRRSRLHPSHAIGAVPRAGASADGGAHPPGDSGGCTPESAVAQYLESYAAGQAEQLVADRDTLLLRLLHFKPASALAGRDNTGREDTPDR